jgi:hypothetical protein
MKTYQVAARELRRHLHLSQQGMATCLRLSMGAVRNHESGAVEAPDARSAAAYMLGAGRAERWDLAQIFRLALYRALDVGNLMEARILARYLSKVGFK